MRRAAKRDSSEPDIVRDLGKLGFDVVKLKLPVDLAIRKKSWPGGLFMMAEVKNATKTGTKPAPRSDRKAQTAFIEQHGVPVVTDINDAITALKAVWEI
jgi:hypothetical protein